MYRGLPGFLYLVRNSYEVEKRGSARFYNILELARVFRGLKKTKNGKYGVQEHDYIQSRQETTNGIGNNKRHLA